MRTPCRGRLTARAVGAACVIALGPLMLGACGSAARGHRQARSDPRTRDGAQRSGVGRLRAAVGPGAAVGRPPFAVGLRVLHLVDHRRTIELAGGVRRPRPITTIVRYPAVGPRGHDLPAAAAARAAGPFPLIVFGHGFAATPAIYAGLLRAWAAAGFVVAAPVFPLSNARAPGGPDERDLDNQPQDMRVVIDRLLAADARPRGWASGLIDRRAIAVAGHSDGGETALAVAYDRVFHDPRVRAAVLLSGAQLPDGGPTSLVTHGPPLLAVQGSADTVDPPARTAAFFASAGPPKFLLTLIGASHAAPYTTEQRQLSIVERVSIAFLRTYLGPVSDRTDSLRALRRAARRPGITELQARP